MNEKLNLIPPIAKKIPHQTKIHGRVLEDPYHWICERDSQEVLNYLQAENAYTDAVMKPTEPLQEKIYQELLGRIKETDLSVPVRKGDFYYYSRTEKGKAYSIYCRKLENLEAPEQILLDINELAKGYEYFDLGVFTISPDQRLLAYSTDQTGEEVYTLYVKDLKTGEMLSDVIPNTATSVVWAANNKTIFYSVLDDIKRPYKLYRHELATSCEQDVEVFWEKDEKYYISFSKSKDRKYLLLDLSSKLTSEVYFLDAEKPYDDFTLIHARELEVEYSVEHYEGKFLILTNDQALNFRLMEVPVATPQKSHWKEVIAHRLDSRIEDIDVCKGYLIVFKREHSLERIQVINFATGENHEIKFEESVYTVGLGNNPEFDTEILRLSYSSMITPGTVYDYNLRTRERELKKQQEVLGGYKKDQYATERIFVPSHDGIEVPVSLVYKKGIKQNGNNPFYLYGYGSYGITMDPHFSSTRLSLLDRGFIFAIAHIRGGGEMGRVWEDTGKLLSKQNTFLDFIACAEYFIDKKYTSPKKLVTSGGSAGGLLMGAVINMRPDLFHAAILDVPFVDVINTMLDETLPLTVTEYEEWGNPNEIESFEYMHSYSPYDNLSAQDYPHLLVTGGLYDPRVQYWEPTKWVAKVRSLKKNSNHLLLKINMSAGHGGPSGRYEFLKEVAFHYAFFLFALDLQD